MYSNCIRAEPDVDVMTARTQLSIFVVCKELNARRDRLRKHPAKERKAHSERLLSSPLILPNMHALFQPFDARLLYWADRGLTALAAYIESIDSKQWYLNLQNTKQIWIGT